MFETQILPTVERYAWKRLRDAEMVATAIVLAWFFWTKRPEDYAAGHWARLAVRNVIAGRDLPGCGMKAKDAMRRATSGGGMDGLMDRSPGPDQIVMDRERYSMVKNRANDRERNLIEMFETGMTASEAAVKLKVSGGRITQLRQGLMGLDE